MNYDEPADFADKRKFLEDFSLYISAHEDRISSWRCLEVGGGGGTLAGIMASKVRHIIATDVVSSAVAYEGNALPLLIQKFERNALQFPVERVEFLTADAQDLPFRDNWFDLSFSQNAFEHIPDPEAALRELARVTRPGGYIYVMFDPVWTADTGSHFFHYMQEPWAHLLEDDQAVMRRMMAAGAGEQELISYSGHMNRLPATYYREMFPRVIDELGLTKLLHHEWSGCVDESHLSHPNRARAAAALGIDEEDLLVRGFRFLLRV